LSEIMSCDESPDDTKWATSGKDGMTVLI